ncbi:hypothetical protein P4E94_09615 [Pontiellaceae bacterium B12219]|nr:hypothetical protein [Pontiellaceae bacterium B12219]
MKKLMSIAAVALFVAGSSAFAGSACCGAEKKAEAKKECKKADDASCKKACDSAKTECSAKK